MAKVKQPTLPAMLTKRARTRRDDREMLELDKLLMALRECVRGIQQQRDEYFVEALAHEAFIHERGLADEFATWRAQFTEYRAPDDLITQPPTRR